MMHEPCVVFCMDGWLSEGVRGVQETGKKTKMEDRNRMCLERTGCTYVAFHRSPLHGIHATTSER